VQSNINQPRRINSNNNSHKSLGRKLKFSSALIIFVKGGKNSCTI
jgi:hypothetical protein